MMITKIHCFCVVCVISHSPVRVNIQDQNHSPQDQSQRAQYQHGYLPAHPYIYTHMQHIIHLKQPPCQLILSSF